VVKHKVRIANGAVGVDELRHVIFAFRPAATRQPFPNDLRVLRALFCKHASLTPRRLSEPPARVTLARFPFRPASCHRRLATVSAHG
jgi:hypothetical protein